MQVALSIWMASILAFAAWALLAAWRFTVRYKKVYGVDLIAEQQRDFLRETWSSQTLLTWKLMWKKQDDSQLETARRFWVIGTLLAFGVPVFGFVLLAVLASAAVL